MRIAHLLPEWEPYFHDLDEVCACEPVWADARVVRVGIRVRLLIHREFPAPIVA